MKAPLSSFQAVRIAARKLFPFAVALAVLFTVCAFAQYLHVTRQNRAATEAELESTAGRISQELAFTNSWNLTGFRHAELAASSYFIFTRDGFQIEMGEFIPGLIERVALIDDSIYEKPKTVATPVGEKWRLLGKKVKGGFVALGTLDLDDDLQDLDLADRRIRSEAAKFGLTLGEAMQVRPRGVASKIDYAVIDDSGKLKVATGWFPLRILTGQILDAAATKSTVRLNGSSYFLLRHSILGGSGTPVGQIVVSKDVTAGERAVGSLVLFNLGMGGLCWLAVVLLVGAKVASSAKSMGKFSRLREPSERVIQGNFHRVIGAEAIGSSGHHSDFVVQALDGAAGDFSFGLEPVHQ